MVPDVANDSSLFRIDPNTTRLLTDVSYTLIFETALPLVAPVVSQLLSHFSGSPLAWVGWCRGGSHVLVRLSRRADGTIPRLDLDSRRSTGAALTQCGRVSRVATTVVKSFGRAVTQAKGFIDGSNRSPDSLVLYIKI